MTKSVCVIGAGIIGLTSALSIQEQIPDVSVTIIADKFSPNTTSDGSGGFWQPHLLNPTQAVRIRKWSEKTLQNFLSLLKSGDASDVGAQLLSGYNFSMDDKQIQETDWKEQVFGFRKLTQEELSLHPNMKSGVFYTTVQINVKQYLPWLMKKFRARGGNITMRKIESIEEISNEFDVILNSTGMSSNKFVNDNSLQPIRGQVIRVRAPWIKHFYIATDPSDSNNTIYVLPFVDNVTLGGTSQTGNWSTEISQTDRDRIWSGCTKLLPSLQDAEVITDWVGLRPSRPEIRVELEEYEVRGGKIPVIHNYGHSGSGITLCWGCAEEAAGLVKTALRKMKSSASKL